MTGIGTGAGSSVFGFLTRITAPEDRSTVFAAVMACRQAGLLIGQFVGLIIFIWSSFQLLLNEILYDFYGSRKTDIRCVLIVDSVYLDI